MSGSGTLPVCDECSKTSPFYVYNRDTLAKLRDLSDANELLDHVFFTPPFFTDYFWFKFNRPGPKYAFWAVKDGKGVACDEEDFFTTQIYTVFIAADYANVIVSRDECLRYRGVMPPPPQTREKRDAFIMFAREFPGCEIESNLRCRSQHLEKLRTLEKHHYDAIYQNISEIFGIKNGVSWDDFHNDSEKIKRDCQVYGSSDANPTCNALAMMYSLAWEMKFFSV